MRPYQVLSILLSSFIIRVLGEPIAVDVNPRKLALVRERSFGGGEQRVGKTFGRAAPGDVYANVNEQANRRHDVRVNALAAAGAAGGTSNGAGYKRGGPGTGETTKEPGDGASNYLITLERTVTNDVKDKILDILLRSGAVVKQTYDYRVFKGILFTVPSNDDKGLSSWQSSLGKQDGVKYVEEDSVVRIQ